MVTDAMSPRTNTHWQVPPRRPRIVGPERLRGSRKWPLTMARLAVGTTIPGTRIDAACGGTARINPSSEPRSMRSRPKSSAVARSPLKWIPLSRALKRTEAPRPASHANAGRTRHRLSPWRATRGRQAFAPRAKVSRITAPSKIAAPSVASALSTATAIGSQNRRNNGPSGQRHSATVTPGPARISLRTARYSPIDVPGTRRRLRRIHQGIGPTPGRTVQRRSVARSRNGISARSGPTKPSRTPTASR